MAATLGASGAQQQRRRSPGGVAGEARRGVRSRGCAPLPRTNRDGTPPAQPALGGAGSRQRTARGRSHLVSDGATEVGSHGEVAGVPGGACSRVLRPVHLQGPALAPLRRSENLCRMLRLQAGVRPALAPRQAEVAQCELQVWRLRGLAAPNLCAASRSELVEAPDGPWRSLPPTPLVEWGLCAPPGAPCPG